MFIMRLLVLVMKKFHYLQLATIVQWVTFVNTYLIANLYNLYVHKITNREFYHNPHTDHDSEPRVITQTAYWLKLELFYFMANVFGIMLFLSIAFFRKYQPIFKKKYEKEVEVSTEMREKISQRIMVRKTTNRFEGL